MNRTTNQPYDAGGPETAILVFSAIAVMIVLASILEKKEKKKQEEEAGFNFIILLAAGFAALVALSGKGG